MLLSNRPLWFLFCILPLPRSKINFSVQLVDKFSRELDSCSGCTYPDFQQLGLEEDGHGGEGDVGLVAKAIALSTDTIF